MFVSKRFQISQKFHRGDRKHVKVCKEQISQNQLMSHFSLIIETSVTYIV